MSLELSKKAQAVKPSSTLAITAKAKELKAKGIDVASFGAGEPDFNTPDNINEAAVKAIWDGFTKYTVASGTKELKEAVCRKFKKDNNLDYKPSQIVVSNGGKHSLTNIFNAILNPLDEVIIPIPYWLSYSEIVKLSDGVPVYIIGEKTRQYKVTAKQIEDAITDRTKVLILNSPSNPTGMLYTREELEEIADVVVRNDIYVLSDEMYEHLLYDDAKHISIASLNEEIYKRTITCSGVAKSYAMTGWRIGFTASTEELARVMGNLQSHQTSNPNSIAQKAAEEALNGSQETVENMRQEFDKRRKYMANRIAAMPHVDALTPQGAFYFFVDISEVLKKTYEGQDMRDANEVAHILLNDYKVAVIPCVDFGCKDHIRLSYATSLDEIEKGLDRIENFLKDL